MSRILLVLSLLLTPLLTPGAANVRARWLRPAPMEPLRAPAEPHNMSSTCRNQPAASMAA